MWFIRIVWKYNLLYVFDSTIDSKGLFYPQALFHLIIGLYMAEICLVGLFALKKSFGPVVMMVMFLVFTVLVHITLSDAIAPLLQNLPQTMASEEDIQAETTAPESAETSAGGAASTYYDVEEAFGSESEAEDQDMDEQHDPVTTDRALEGGSSVRSAVTDWLKATVKSKVEIKAQESGISQIFGRLDFWQKEGEPPNLITRWLHPDDFVALRKTIPTDLLSIDRSDDSRRGNYLPPELWMPKPTLWIPRDQARVSRQEVAQSRKVVPISDFGAVLNDRGRVTVDLEQSPLRKRRTF